MALACARVTSCLLPCTFRGFVFCWSLQFHSSAAGFGQTDCNRLFGIGGSMFAFSDVMHFFANKFSCLRTRRFPFTCVFSCAFESFFVWHKGLLVQRSRAAVGSNIECVLYSSPLFAVSH